MILAKLCELARREELLTNPDYEPKPVAWIITVGDDGKFTNLAPTVGDDSPRSKRKAKMFLIPRRTGRTSAAVGDFIVDKSEYVLGVEPDGKRTREALQLRLGLFRERVRSAREATGAPSLVAVEAFLNSDVERGHAIERVQAEKYKSNDLFAFEHGGQLVHELAVAQEYFSRVRRAVKEGGAQCLVCGSQAPPVANHPAVK